MPKNMASGPPPGQGKPPARPGPKKPARVHLYSFCRAVFSTEIKSLSLHSVNLTAFGKIYFWFTQPILPFFPFDQTPCWLQAAPRSDTRLLRVLENSYVG